MPDDEGTNVRTWWTPCTESSCDREHMLDRDAIRRHQMSAEELPSPELQQLDQDATALSAMAGHVFAATGHRGRELWVPPALVERMAAAAAYADLDVRVVPIEREGNWLPADVDTSPVVMTREEYEQGVRDGYVMPGGPPPEPDGNAQSGHYLT